MPTTKEYITEYGNISFSDRPFSDPDAIAFCEITYMPLEKVVSERFTDEPVKFGDAAYQLFALRNFKHKNLGLMISANPSKKILNMGSLRRYNEVKIVACKEVYSKNPAVQFGAATYILPDGTLVICFRGTNDDIAGWKEDIDLFTNNGSPSYTLALEYIENAAKNFEGDIILIGHSKGGNVALYTALKCSEEIRKRIKCVYNHDGPGFRNYDIFKTGSYDEILPNYKHYIPSSSFIGVLLAHDYDYKAVKSSMHLGPFQHDLGSWQIENGEVVFVNDTDKLSKITDIWLAQLVSRASNEEYSKALDSVLTAVTEGTGQRTLTDFAKHLPSSLSGAVKAYKGLDKSTKDNFKEAFSGSVKLLGDSIKEVKNNVDVKEFTSKLFN